MQGLQVPGPGTEGSRAPRNQARGTSLPGEVAQAGCHRPSPPPQPRQPRGGIAGSGRCPACSPSRSPTQGSLVHWHTSSPPSRCAHLHSASAPAPRPPRCFSPADHLCHLLPLSLQPTPPTTPAPSPTVVPQPPPDSLHVYTLASFVASSCPFPCHRAFAGLIASSTAALPSHWSPTHVLPAPMSPRTTVGSCEPSSCLCAAPRDDWPVHCHSLQ